VIATAVIDTAIASAIASAIAKALFVSALIASALIASAIAKAFIASAIASTLFASALIASATTASHHIRRHLFTVSRECILLFCKTVEGLICFGKLEIRLPIYKIIDLIDAIHVNIRRRGFGRRLF
jgi:hypothetical protein